MEGVLVASPVGVIQRWTAALRERNAATVPSVDSADASGRSSPIDRVSGENFTVAARLLPQRVRRHLLAVYVFARLVDDIGDEASGNRLILLDKVSRDLDHIYTGRMPAHEMLHDLAVTIDACGIPREPFQRLIEANRRDQVMQTYETYQELLDYCVLSANPVGHLVLYVFGAMSEHRKALADQVCTALQILEHCQDVAEDLQRGRVYVPREDMARFWVEEHDLKAATASTEVRALIAFEVQRAVRMLEMGPPLVASLHGTARLAVAGYLAGGRATAEALRASDYDVLARTVRPAKTRMLREWSGLLASGVRW
ncbi:MAG: squalene synthase HpnC [Sciscionella sp.]